MMMQFRSVVTLVVLVVLCLLDFRNGVSGTTIARHHRTTSPRDDLIKYLAKQGCTNRVIAIMVIQAYKSNTGTATLIDRLKGVTTLPTSLITTWINAVQSYETLAKVKI
jgi:hypothetical protein